ncbi:SH3 domain-binding glutamic acid-rich protein homolog [Trichonephila inaurata madagascariensis]|uniref:SH3 domain-binding glutamic acid-rich protein homolog n=1 Tax=Trichonephila inaurata madagascariensis TaxID=2747483 RepID=A0A8X6M8Y3_9ARAC|nr:SH3 domain-binding glutamic acid-rich protein homolog [Trichonephila inaurata madagascariensis]
MAIKVYISGICGSQEVRKHQQRVVFILQGLPIDLQIIDVTDPGREEDLTFMQEEAKKHDKKTQLPPQIFNENEYCGDYADFELANDDDEILRFLKLEDGKSKSESSEEKITQNGIENHENNQENSASNEEPISNGINDVDNETKESELISTEANVEETSNIEVPTTEGDEVIAEETKDDEASSKVEETTKEKESSEEEESEEESE